LRYPEKALIIQGFFYFIGKTLDGVQGFSYDIKVFGI